MIFRNATATHLAIARILIFGILLLDLLLDDLPSLAAMPVDAFLPHGVLKLVPGDMLAALLQEASLRYFSWIYGFVLVLGLVGLGPSWLATGAALIGTTWFHGLARGFGGHVNHQELIALHALFFFLFPQGYSRLSVNCPRRPARPRSGDEDDVSRFLLRGLTFWLLFTYFLIGVARLQTSDWHVYGTNAMTFYALQHSIKWNYLDFSWARDILNQRPLDLALRVSFPFATLLEVAAPLAVFFRRLVWPIALSLILFHLGILVLMNIFFWQNLLLLLLPLMGWFIDRGWSPVRDTGERLVVFYDSACGLCDGFIRQMAKCDTFDLLRFAPLGGETARLHGIELPSNRRTWTIIVIDGGVRLERSDAALRILATTRSWGDMAEFVSIIPRFIRDAVYCLIAHWRHLVTLPNDQCSIPEEFMVRKFLP